MMASSFSQAALVEWQFHKTEDGAHPTGQEQQLLWLMNRARANPGAEGNWLASSSENDVSGGREYFNVDTSKLRNEFYALDSMPPAAWDRRLYTAARAHALNLIARDAQDHNGQRDRVTASGFNWATYRGNVFSYADNALNAHAAFNIDWGSTPDGMQAGRGHRKAIMSTDGDYTNVGIAALAENNAATDVGKQVVVGNYVYAYTSTDDHYNQFIVGTVYEDKNFNGRYDVGEGVPNVVVIPDTGNFYAVTSAGGGYSIPVTFQGEVTISFASAGVAEDYKTTVTVSSGKSVLVDYVTNADTTSSEVFPAVTLQVNQEDNGAYGFRWGRSSNPVSVKTQFAGTGGDMAISVQGFDIARSDEVQVFLNGNPIGFLNASTSPGGLNASESFLLSSSELQGWNTVEFVQRQPGKRWGVTGLKLSEVLGDDIAPLAVGVVDGNQYGRPGRHHGTVKTEFYARDKDLLLTVFGFDVSSNTEISVYLNGNRIRYLTAGNPGALAPVTVIVIPRSQLASNGNNKLEFRADRPWAIWGVRNILVRDITPQEQDVVIGGSASSDFGLGFGSYSYAVMRARLETRGRDVRVRYLAHHIDDRREVAVYLNGRFLRYVEETGVSGTHWRYLDISASDLDYSGNTLEFIRLNPVGRWGIGRVQLFDTTRDTVDIEPGVISATRYGWRPGVPVHSTHPGMLRMKFNMPAETADMTFYSWDIGNAREIDIYLNGRYVGSADPTPTPGRPALTRIVLPASYQTGGNNYLEFRQFNAPDYVWGISHLRVLARPVTPDGGSSDPASPLSGSADEGVDVSASASQNRVLQTVEETMTGVSGLLKGASDDLKEQQPVTQ